jgi:hypothetical protein
MSTENKTRYYDLQVCDDGITILDIIKKLFETQLYRFVRTS